MLRVDAAVVQRVAGRHDREKLGAVEVGQDGRGNPVPLAREDKIGKDRTGHGADPYDGHRFGRGRSRTGPVPVGAAGTGPAPVVIRVVLLDADAGVDATEAERVRQGPARAPLGTRPRARVGAHQERRLRQFHRGLRGGEPVRRRQYAVLEAQ